MKKLMIAVAIVCAAAMSQAAQFDWRTKAGSSNSVYVNGSTENTYNGTAFIFLASSASDIFTAWNKGEDWTTATLDTSSAISSGKIATKEDAFTTSVNPIDAIFATAYVGADGTKYLYISGTGSATAGDIGATTISFAGNAALSQAAALDAKNGFAGAGHWYAQSVPEPTSGLLLLLGVAGLALRRRRA